MIETIEFNNPNIIGARLVGKLTKESTAPWVMQIKEKLQQPGGKLRMYLELDKMEGVTPEAAFQELKFKTTTGRLGDFDKVAFVSDSTWVDVIAFFADLFPGVDAKEFATADKEAAKQWVKN